MFNQQRNDFRELPARELALERAVASRLPAPHKSGYFWRAAKSHFREAVERFAIVRLRWKEQTPAASLDCRRVLEQGRIMALHVAQMKKQGLSESVSIGKAGKAGKPFQSIPIGGQRMGLLIGHHLQTVFHHTEETISRAELVAYALAHPAADRQGTGRL